jgi:hypothetical protein
MAKELLPDKNVYRLAFADALKEEVYDLLLKPNNIPYDYLNDPVKKKIFRTFMQWYGTEFRRNPEIGGDNNYWISRLFEKIIKIQSEDPDAIIIVCDMRFYNELNALKNVGAYIVNVVRDSVYDPSEAHISETELDSYHHLFDYFAMNNGTLEDYKVNVETIIDFILAEKQLEKIM